MLTRELEHMEKEQLIALWCIFLHEGLITGEVMNITERHVLEAANEGALELYMRLYGVAEIIHRHTENDLGTLLFRPPVFEYDVVSILGTRLQAQLLDTRDVGFVFSTQNVETNLQELLAGFQCKQSHMQKIA
jgi:hypothetical protein